MEKLNIPLSVAKAGAHLNDFLNACYQNPSYRYTVRELCDSSIAGLKIRPCSIENLKKHGVDVDLILKDAVGKCFLNMHWSLDSSIDQLAIREGYNFCKNMRQEQTRK